jgi:magnesium transporter
MSVVAAAVYSEGRRVRSLSIEDDDGWRLEPGEFAWIGLHEPEAAEFRFLTDRFDLHPLAVEDALLAHQMPKVEIYGHQLFVVALTARLEDAAIAYGETAIFLGPQHIITVRHGSVRAHTTLRGQLEAAPDLLRHGVDYVLHGVLDFIVDGYRPVEEQIEEEVLDMERRALEAPLEQEDLRRIFQLRGELLRFRRILGPMREVCSRLDHQELPCIDPEVRPYFRDVGDHVRRVESTAEGLREVMTSVFEASLLLEQQRQGVITRQLAAWAAILAVPTAIAGVYGMNFQNMPELRWRYGYYVILAVIAGLCALLYARFKRWGWL